MANAVEQVTHRSPEESSSHAGTTIALITLSTIAWGLLAHKHHWAYAVEAGMALWTTAWIWISAVVYALRNRIEFLIDAAINTVAGE